MILVLGLSFFIFFTKSNPFIPGILRSEIIRIYPSLLFVKCLRASYESLKVKTDIPSISRKASPNSIVMSSSSSTIPTVPFLGDICTDSKDADVRLNVERLVNLPIKPRASDLFRSIQNYDSNVLCKLNSLA
jgi:hypothetical protein